MGEHIDVIGNHEGRVEANTEMTNQRILDVVSFVLESASCVSDTLYLFHGLLEELLGTGTSNYTKAVLHLLLGHTNTRILDGDGALGLIDEDLDVERNIRVVDLGTRHLNVSALLQSIGGVADQLSEENLLVGVDGVGDNL